jgi:hypothetical protein
MRVGLLINVGSWVATADAVAGRAGEFAWTVEIVNRSFYYGLLAAAILSAGMLVFRIVEPIQRWRCWRGRERRELRRGYDHVAHLFLCVVFREGLYRCG